MLLVVDIGNTHTVLGIYDQDRLIHMWRLATNVEYTSDELRIKLRALLSAEGDRCWRDQGRHPLFGGASAHA